MKLKLNWGHKILLLYLSFIAMVIFMITKSMQQRVDLVAADYYDREIKYQQKYSMMQNSLSLNTPVEIIYDQSRANIVLAFPANLLKEAPGGVIHFIKPDNSSMDFELAINTNEKYIQQIPVSQMNRGIWNIEVTWHADGNVYFDSDRILLK